MMIARGDLRAGARVVISSRNADACAEAERDHLFHLARQSRAPSGPRRRRPAVTVRPALQQVLDAITDAPAWICNGRYDVLAMNHLARARYSPVLADARRPANTARFVYLDPESAKTRPPARGPRTAQPYWRRGRPARRSH